MRGILAGLFGLCLALTSFATMTGSAKAESYVSNGGHNHGHGGYSDMGFEDAPRFRYIPKKPLYPIRRPLRNDEGYLGLPHYHDHGKRSTRKHRRSHRKHHRMHHRGHRKVRRHHRAPRTKFCRKEVHQHGRGWGAKKYKVKRCVWVRRDLLRY